MDLGLKGKVAIITGGASGLGRETAHYLIRDEARVLIADQNAENIEKVLSELQREGGEAEGLAMDTRRHDSADRSADPSLGLVRSLLGLAHGRRRHDDLGARRALAGAPRDPVPAAERVQCAARVRWRRARGELRG